MTDEARELRRDPVFRHFYDICQIPHGSGDEQALSDHIVAWARGLGLEVEQDTMANVLVRRPAGPGREGGAGVLLQAHMDMVCERAEGVEHDFARDPIAWEIDGDMLSTGGRTTLGADDGIGMALAMAALEDPRLDLPPLEVLFTVGEEEDFRGVMSFDASSLRSRWLINLDHTSGREIVCGSCGGMRADFFLPLERGPVPLGWEALRLSVSGLEGGHGGEDIHRGRGNANVFLARLLLAAEGHCRDLRIASLEGGSSRLAIPREASAVVCLPSAQEPGLLARVEELARDMRAELAVTGPRLKVGIEPAEPPTGCVHAGPIVSAMTLIPDGIFQMDETLEGLVDTSDNLGEARLDEEGLRLVLEIRSARDSLRSYLFQRMERLAALLGGSCGWSEAYPSWGHRPGSPLLSLCGEAYRALWGEEPAYKTVHAGLEVGFLLERRPDLEAVSMGADCWGFHSPSERASVSSVRRAWRTLCGILSALAERG